MIHRIAIAVAALIWFFIAAPTVADERATAYAFVTLYSPAHRLVPDRTRTKKSAEARDGYKVTARSSGNRRVPSSRPLRWEDRIPWWREEAIERGSLPPFDQERAFEQSLESGRAYYEGSRHAQGGGGSSYGAGIPGQSGTALSKVEIAAVLWLQTKSQKPTGLVAGKTLPGSQAPGPSTRYKGVTLIGAAYPGVENEAFFRTAKKAIDMAMALPEGLRDLARRIEVVAYDPPSKHRQAAGAIVDIDAAYAITDRRRKAPVILYRDARLTSPQHVALSLIGGGVMAARHQRLMSLLRTQGKSETETGQAKREIDERLAPIAATDPALVNEAECELQSILHRADKALDVSAQEVRARLRVIRERNCR